MDRRGFMKNSIATAATVGCAVSLGPLARRAQGTRKLPIRPPGALPEDEFLATCIRCLRCVDACPNEAIRSLDGDSFGSQCQSTPALQPRRKSCMLCNKTEGEYLKCTEVCPSGALQKIRLNILDIQENVQMGIAKLDTALCYSYNNSSCGVCYRACPLPERAMSIGMWERPIVHEEACIGCGLCERACIRYPQAIRIESKPRTHRVPMKPSQTSAKKLT